MSNRKADLLLKNLEMAILAMDTLDEMEISDETQIFDSTLRNKMFIQNIESEVLQSIFSSTSEKTMAYGFLKFLTSSRDIRQPLILQRKTLYSETRSAHFGPGEAIYLIRKINS